MRIVIADDAVLLREGAARLLEDAGFEVVGQAGDADDLMRKVRAHKPDVAIIDVRMPPDNSDDGLRAALSIRQELPDVGILLLSQYVEDRYIGELLAGGTEGVGYLLKDRVGEIERFTEAVQRIGRGGSVLDPEVVAQMVGRREEPLSELTDRERDVLALMAEGYSNRAIAETIFVSERAVERHVTSIFSKLGLEATGQEHRRVLAVLRYLQA
ncbi:MAG TPA: response regulator transcription factor [Thermoleophilaceae bacterium]|nr:response regulator transcription factor [Thermoleophilaceae bacterium]